MASTGKFNKRPDTVAALLRDSQQLRAEFSKRGDSRRARAMMAAAQLLKAIDNGKLTMKNGRGAFRKSGGLEQISDLAEYLESNLPVVEGFSSQLRELKSELESGDFDNARVSLSNLTTSVYHSSFLSEKTKKDFEDCIAAGYSAINGESKSARSPFRKSARRFRKADDEVKGDASQTGDEESTAMHAVIQALLSLLVARGDELASTIMSVYNPDLAEESADEEESESPEESAAEETSGEEPDTETMPEEEA